MLIELLRRGVKVDKICFANTGKEKEETLVFVKQVGEYLNREIVWLEFDDTIIDHSEKGLWFCNFFSGVIKPGFKVVTFETASRKGEPFELLLRKRNFLPNVVARFCTQELKIRPQKKFLMSIGFERWVSYIGIRHDEPHRWVTTTQNQNNKQRWDNECPMVEWGTTKQHVNEYWQGMPFNLNLQAHEGNCDLCFLKGKHKRLQIIRDKPETADWWDAMEKHYGATWIKHYSVQDLIRAANQPLLFDEYDIDYPCFCNSD